MLTQLRVMIGLKPEQDIQKEQWDFLQNQLFHVSNRILQQLRLVGDAFLAKQENPSSRKLIMNALGELELEVVKAYNFFDTFMDILTQRLSDNIGPMLRGCDVIAADGMRRGMIADLTIPPLVYCDRGFGASTLREGVNITELITNPIPFISIPYSRLTEKYNLISIYHEVGHQALVKLDLINPISRLIKTVTSKAGATPVLQILFSNWSRELAPDFWAFCLSGMAQTCSLRDVLILPRNQMFYTSPSQVHPPAYIRFLISTEWCRQMWGKGIWDIWEHEWKEMYNPNEMDKATAETIRSAVQWIPAVAGAFLKTKFNRLNGKTLRSLFSMNMLEPNFLLKFGTTDGIKSSKFTKLPIGSQLAVFRLMRETRLVKKSAIDSYMKKWLRDIQLK